MSDTAPRFEPEASKDSAINGNPGVQKSGDKLLNTGSYVAGVALLVALLWIFLLVRSMLTVSECWCLTRWSLGFELSSLYWQ